VFRTLLLEREGRRRARGRFAAVRRRLRQPQLVRIARRTGRTCPAQLRQGGPTIQQLNKT